MKATETDIQQLIEGDKQFLVPLFQRTYTWTEDEWEVMWADLVDLYDAEETPGHFIGSIVTIQLPAQPHEIKKYLLIDGQQRLTTIFILLTLLRDKAKKYKEGSNERLADQITLTLLTNHFVTDEASRFKLMPTQVDRDAYKNLIDGKSNLSTGPLRNAYKYFDKLLDDNKRLEFTKIKDTITRNFLIVSIVLDPKENAYLVFESLNAKGQPLTESDLIRNYFFMKTPEDKQQSVYDSYWMPMQSLLSDNLTEYIRHFLMRTSTPIRQNDVYHELKQRAEKKDPIEYLKELNEYSSYYSRLIDPKEKEDDPDLKKYFIRLKRINVTTAYPLILTLYNEYNQGTLTKSDFVEILKTIENFLIRRFVCNIPTNQLNKIFSSVCSALNNSKDGNQVKTIMVALQSKSYPTDIDFLTGFQQKRFYGPGDITKLILETLEDHITPKDVSKEIDQKVKFDDLQIEHIMPQNPDKWKDYLGDNWNETHNSYLNTIGNLTLTGYNPVLGNLEFEKKKDSYVDKETNKGLNLNKYVVSFTSWREDDIKKRAKKLAEQALEIWSYFGQENPSSYDLSNDSELSV